VGGSDGRSVHRDTIAAVFWLMVAVVAVVVFGTAAVAAGAGGTLARPAGDPRPLADLARPVEPADVAAVRFPVVLRGYRMDVVDETLERLGAELAERDARISELEVALGVRPEPGPEPSASEPWPPDTDLAPSDPEQ
jgi:DivIVA domain-containing protein